MEKLDIAIAGAGIAGLAAAALLSRAGHRAVVFDKLDAPEPIGSGLILQPVGLAVLDALGVGAAARALGARIDRLYGRAAPSQRVVLDVRYDAFGPNAPTGYAVHRGALFQLLFDAALAADAEFVARREIIAADARTLSFSDGAVSAQFDLVIDALGMHSPLCRKASTPLAFGALWANLEWCGDFDSHALEQCYERARKMAGVLAIGRREANAPQQAALFWSLKHADYAAWRSAPIAAWKEDVLRLWPETAPLLAQIVRHEDCVFARYAHRTAQPVEAGVARLGDSWHCTSPQLGQGANMALLDALALTRALEMRASRDDALALYARMRHRHVWLYQAASWLFTPAYQSDSAAIAWARDWLGAPLARTPPAPKLLAALVSGAIGAPLGAISAKRAPHSPLAADQPH
ncbi:MAG: NAD(P)/FAD-dependent oxidoreductase [Pseudomonadota bacterium]